MSHFQQRKHTSCTDSSCTLVVREAGGIIARARRSTKWTLVFEEAAMADTAGFALGATEVGVTGKHTEALGEINKGI